jgi:predicted RNA polymerase sigma factor
MTDDRLTTLYRQYGPFIYARCVRLLGDRAAAEDATQETFMRVQRHLHKAPDPKDALGWVYGSRPTTVSTRSAIASDARKPSWRSPRSSVMTSRQRWRTATS